MKIPQVTRASLSAALFGALMMMVAPAPAVAQGNAPAHSYEDEQACSPDVQRLCGEMIPDVERIIACLKQKVSQLNPACRVVMTRRPPRTTKRD